jgi:signal transduction histidine kinase
MRTNSKIASIVLLQVGLILASFLTLYYIENQKANLGDTINIAGLNRYLTSNTISTIYSMKLQNQIQEYIDSETIHPLSELKNNLRVLEEGGTSNGILIKRLPVLFENELNIVKTDYNSFENSIKHMNKDTDILQIQNSGEILIKSSDSLVVKIAKNLEEESSLLIKLQILFLITNTIVHGLLIVSLFKILSKEKEEKIKLERLSTIGELGASIAHDLRNSLTVIKGSLELLKLKTESSQEFDQKQFEKIINSVNDIEYLTKDILEFAQEKKLKKENCSVVEIIKNAIEGLSISNSIHIDIPKNDAIIYADKIKMQTVFSNIIKNAVDEIKNEGKITIKIEDNKEETNIAISDTGKGINVSDIEKIFDPLFTTKLRGTGLGLSSCQRIITEHNGKITLKINPTTFLIKLPKITKL